MGGYLERVSRPGLAACAVLTLLAVGCMGPGETKFVEISDTAHPPVTVSDQVTVATSDPEAPQSAPVTSAETPSGDAGPVATVTTDRLVERGPQAAVGPPPTPPTTVPTGIAGLPFAPAGLDGCEEMSWYRRQWNLPAHFDTVGFRESTCRNWVTSWTGCCHGWWQIHELHIGERHLEHCDIYQVADLSGHAPIVKQRQACAALAIYRVQGPEAWSQTW